MHSGLICFTIDKWLYVCIVCITYEGSLDLNLYPSFHQVCVKRIMQRSLSSGRSDDNEESLRKRFKTYYNHTMPIIQYYERQGLVKKIGATQQPDEVSIMLLLFVCLI